MGSELTKEQIEERRAQAVNFEIMYRDFPSMAACGRLDQALCDMALASLSERKWIPVSERLPEGRALFHLTYKDEQCIESGEFHEFEQGGWTVTHWQPLPDGPLAHQAPEGKE